MPVRYKTTVNFNFFKVLVKEKCIILQFFQLFLYVSTSVCHSEEKMYIENVWKQMLGRRFEHKIC
jgi:hypothetical protein